MRKLPLVFSLILAATVGYCADVEVKAFTPSSDQAQTLGTATSRWRTLYANAINDGAGNDVQISDLSASTTFARELNHSALTAESRSAANSHPISAITGLTETIAGINDKLQPVTQSRDGLMTRDDKFKLDNLEAQGGVQYTSTGEIRLPIDKAFLGTDNFSQSVPLVKVSTSNEVTIGDTLHDTVINSRSRPIVTLPGSTERIAYQSDIVSDTADVVRYAEGGNILLYESGQLLLVDENDDVLSLIGPSEDGDIEVGDAVKSLTLNSADRPTVQTGSATESMAYVSDLADYVTTDDLGGLDFGSGGQVKTFIADGVSLEYTLVHDLGTDNVIIDIRDDTAGEAIGVKTTVSESQIVIATSVALPKDHVIRVIIISADGRISGGSGGGTIDHAELINRDNANQHPIGAITGLQAALDAKANTDSPAFAGTPTAPTAAAGTSTTQIATTKFVQDAVAAGGGTVDLSDYATIVFVEEAIANASIGGGEIGDVTDWNATTNYADPKLVRGSNNGIYKLLFPNGPDTELGVRDPVTEPVIDINNASITSVALPTTSAWVDSAYTGSRFIIISSSGGAPVSWNGSGSSSWGLVPTLGNGSYASVVSDKLGGVLALTGSDTAIKYSSSISNGAWTDTNSTAGITWTSGAYGNGVFVAAGTNTSGLYYTIKSPSSAISWTETFGVTHTLKSPIVRYGNDAFVLIGNYPISPARAYVSKDYGESWEAGGLIATGLTAMAYGKGTFVAIAGENNNVVAITKDNGTTWTSSSLPTNAYWNDIEYGGGIFIAIAGNTNQAAYSIDEGKTWRSFLLPAQANWNSITFGDNKFVVSASDYGYVAVIDITNSYLTNCWQMIG